MLIFYTVASHAKDAGTTRQRFAIPLPLSGFINALTSTPARRRIPATSAAATPAAKPIRNVSQSQYPHVPDAADDAHDADADANGHGHGYGYGHGEPVWHPTSPGDAPERHATPEPWAACRRTKLHGHVGLLKLSRITNEHDCGGEGHPHLGSASLTILYRSVPNENSC